MKKKRKKKRCLVVLVAGTEDCTKSIKTWYFFRRTKVSSRGVLAWG